MPETLPKKGGSVGMVRKGLQNGDCSNYNGFACVIWSDEKINTGRKFEHS